MNFKEYKQKALQDPEFKKEYDRFDLCLEAKLFWMRVKIFINKILK